MKLTWEKTKHLFTCNELLLLFCDYSVFAMYQCLPYSIMGHEQDGVLKIFTGSPQLVFKSHPTWPDSLSLSLSVWQDQESLVGCVANSIMSILHHHDNSCYD